jgi:glycosyltransferase involved in cell wall biosynthesis
MKLLFVGTNRGGGGTESHFVTLARTMQEAGHSVAAIVYPGSPIHTGLTGSGVELHNGVFRNAFDPRGFRTVWKVCRESRPEWIVGSFSKEYWPLAILARLLGVKLALFKHMDFPMRPATNYFIPRLADRFIVISAFMAKKFIARGVPAEHIRVLYNPLNLEYFKPDPALRLATRKSLGYADDDIVLGFIGALHPDKGFLQLADAVNQAMIQIPKLKAFWLGDGRAAAALENKLNDGGFASRHSRHKWTADVRPYYAALDMLAIPSVESETFGRVSIEAQASGVPVLCSDIGGIPETLSSGVTGLLLRPGDIPVWRDAIVSMAGEEKLRTSMAEQGRYWVEQHFSAPVIGRQFEKLLLDDSDEFKIESIK